MLVRHYPKGDPTAHYMEFPSAPTRRCLHSSCTTSRSITTATTPTPKPIPTMPHIHVITLNVGPYGPLAALELLLPLFKSHPAAAVVMLKSVTCSSLPYERCSKWCTNTCLLTVSLRADPISWHVEPC